MKREYLIAILSIVATLVVIAAWDSFTFKSPEQQRLEQLNKEAEDAFRRLQDAQRRATPSTP